MIKYEGVLDEIVDGQTATILIESTNKTFHISAFDLPEGAREGDWLNVEVEDGEVVQLTINQQKTAEQKQSVKKRVDRLRRGSNGSKFKRK
ncbi:DUF3006 domain-containing protein [Alkalibacillus silvisoli]|uniref:DUF3006 domain-containing protein n=1 Tax=Alkalibacillus silvisoli TaxID=392823 RepID=A0ABP3JEU4_9BACI